MLHTILGALSSGIRATKSLTLALALTAAPAMAAKSAKLSAPADPDKGEPQNKITTVPQDEITKITLGLDVEEWSRELMAKTIIKVCCDFIEKIEDRLTSAIVFKNFATFSEEGIREFVDNLVSSENVGKHLSDLQWDFIRNRQSSGSNDFNDLLRIYFDPESKQVFSPFCINKDSQYVDAEIIILRCNKWLKRFGSAEGGGSLSKNQVTGNIKRYLRSVFGEKFFLDQVRHWVTRKEIKVGNHTALTKFLTAFYPTEKIFLAEERKDAKNQEGLVYDTTAEEDKRDEKLKSDNENSLKDVVEVARVWEDQSGGLRGSAGALMDSFHTAQDLFDETAIDDDGIFFDCYDFDNTDQANYIGRNQDHDQ